MSAYWLLPISLLTSGIFGYRYFSPSLGVAAQYRTNGVTVSKLKPYDSWESFQLIAREHWQKYCLQDINIYTPTIEPEAGGRVTLDWHVDSSNVLQISFEDQGQPTYACLLDGVGHCGDVEIDRGFVKNCKRYRETR